MEYTLQHKETEQCVGLPPASPGNHRSNGSQAGHALTFKLDHSTGADQRHKVHPNQVSTWKRQAMDGLDVIFSNGTDKARVDHEGEIHDLHAKIGQLTVERDFLAKGFKR